MLILWCVRWQTSKLLKLIQEIEKKKTWPKYFYEANITPIDKPDKGTTKRKNNVPKEAACELKNW
jgi:hypothetical protein